jgi:hypothetical protein
MGSIGSKSKKKENMSSTPKAGAAGAAGKLSFFYCFLRICQLIPPLPSHLSAASNGRNRRLSIAATGKFFGLAGVDFVWGFEVDVD